MVEKIVLAEDMNHHTIDNNSDEWLDQEFLDVEELIVKNVEVNESKAELIIDAMMCHQCNLEQIGSILLPCGEFILCQTCSTIALPINCPICKVIVRGACKTYLS